MEVHFKKIVQTVFSNWAGLQLAVDHSFGGRNSKQIAVQCVDYIVNYLINEPQITLEDIADVLEDIMDQEFNTICEDNSIQEVSESLFKFLSLMRNGETGQCEIEFNKLPPCKEWITESYSNNSLEVNIDSSSSEEEKENAMEEDPGWTTVKSRRKKH